MLIYDNNILENESKNNYIALGSFDGLHLGHLSLVEKVKKLAKQNNGLSIVFTFKNHPRKFINPNSDIKLIMNNAINNNKSYNFQINSYDYKYMYYTNGKAKSILNDWYDSNLSKYDTHIITGNYYCEQAKVKANSSYTMGNENTVVYSSYIPNFKCSTDNNGYGLIENKIGLISYDELAMAGIYYGQVNLDNYLSSDSTWTSSPSGIGDLNGSSYPTIWIMTGTDSGMAKISLIPGSIYYTSFALRPVINLKSNTQISLGDGTKDNPFVVE